MALGSTAELFKLFLFDTLIYFRHPNFVGHGLAHIVIMMLPRWQNNGGVVNFFVGNLAQQVVNAIESGFFLVN